MAIRRRILKAYRPSQMVGDLDCDHLDNGLRSENVERYARMVSRGLRLFDDELPEIHGNGDGVSQPATPRLGSSHGSQDRRRR
jgi:hypothetical protein